MFVSDPTPMPYTASRPSTPSTLVNEEFTKSRSSKAKPSVKPTRVAKPPFDDPSRDLIIRSSDQVDFHVWRCILEEVSPVFADMFVSNVTTGTPSKEDDRLSSHSVIEVKEGSEVLHQFLLTFWPTHCLDRKSYPLDELKLLIAAAHKYQMEMVLNHLGELLVEDYSEKPLQAYAIAVHYNMAAKVVKTAARGYLKLPAEAYVDELELISARSYYHLLAYRRRCTAALAEMMRTLSWLQDQNSIVIAPRDCKCPHDSTEFTIQDKQVVRKPLAWFVQHCRRVAELLKERPCEVAIEDDALCDQAVSEAVKCSGCKGMVHHKLRVFMKLVKEQIGIEIAKVPLQMV